MNCSYSLTNRLNFYWSYFFSKTVLLWFEVKKPKFAMFAHEMRYSLNKLHNKKSMVASPFATEYVETVYGKFHIRPHSTDMSIVSPAYERYDTHYLVRLLARLITQERNILVLDIGAHIGAFSVMVGNRFRGCENLHIKAFEPVAANYSILEKNIIGNNLTGKVEIFNVFLSSTDGEKLPQQCNGQTARKNRLAEASVRKNTHEVRCTLDSVIGNQLRNFNAVVMKIDTEGTESEILKGAGRLFNSGADIYLLVEDFINPKIVAFLEDIGAEFVTKLTPYNSWWKVQGLTSREHIRETD